jgi:hypothetical protein
MRAAAAAVLLFAAACSADNGPPLDASMPPDLLPSQAMLLVGLWQEPGSGYILRFTADGQQRLAATVDQLDSNPLLTGTWTLDGRRLTFTSVTGLCASPPASQTGTYVVTVTPTALAFTVDMDLCAQRATIDGETWTRSNADGGTP